MAADEAFTSIPDLSLARWTSGSAADRQRFADELCTVCHHVGFFHLTDHGVSLDFLDDYFGLLASFFALPEEVKATIDKRRSRHFRGWERVGAELTDNRIDYREQLDVSTEHPPRTADVQPPYLRLDGPNQWLDEARLPGFRDAVDEFFRRLGEVADELMRAVEVGLGLPAGEFARRFGERPTAYAKLISYPPTPPGEAGVNAHHDAGFLTLLQQHLVGGLQVVNPAGEWIDVPPRRDAFVVNLGENLQAMTGNFFVATTHRVIATEARFSSAYFHGPDLRMELQRLSLPPHVDAAVAASPRHRSAGFMAKRDELLSGGSGTSSTSTTTYGEQLWNYYVRSYPENVAAHYPDAAV